jgi:prolyl-tRNA editing enzyme YbaK/EbsC (Cys-tRNA(Pro) deacylase)
VALEIRLLADSARTLESTAAAVDAELGQMVKSQVFVAPRPHGRLVPIVCLVSGRQQADPAALAAVTGEVAVRHATERETRGLTGYPIGGIPPFGHGRDVRVLMDQGLGLHQWVWAVAGACSAVFQVSPSTLRMLSSAIVAPLVQA